ncbi:hypothetical protein ACWGID_10130 [Kribbella sp. NPDC054772]
MDENRTGRLVDLRLLLVLLAVVTVALAAFVLTAVRRPVVPADAPTTKGEVVKIDAPSRKSGTHWIEIAYTLPGGRWLASRTTQFRAEDATVGRQVQIRYTPDHPERIAIAEVTETWISRWLRTLLAAAAELALLFPVLRRWREQRIGVA